MDEITAQQEIAFIKKIMQDSRKVVYSDGIEFIYWGIIVVICLCYTYFSIFLGGTKYIFYVWLALIFLGYAGNAVFLKRRYKKIKASSIAGNLLGLIWAASGIAMTLVGFIGGFSGAIKGVFISPLMCSFLGIAYFLSGYIYGKKWITSLAFFWWAGAVVMFLVPGAYSLLLMAAMMIILQIVPGIILYKDSKLEFTKTI